MSIIFSYLSLLPLLLHPPLLSPFPYPFTLAIGKKEKKKRGKKAAGKKKEKRPLGLFKSVLAGLLVCGAGVQETSSMSSPQQPVCLIC